ncbi:MAG: glycosyltransferase family 4 protein [Actinomycetota bacterium]|nr:glycosyltransferase family 4 protein [Actinomycetota bacterium]
MRVGLDATPLLGSPTGVGRYVAGLVGGLAALPDPPELTLTAFTVRGGAGLRPAAVTAGAGAARILTRRLPARALLELWARGPVPPVEWLTGRLDVFHGTNFVLPPRRGAAGVVTVHDLAYDRFPDLVSAASRRYRELVPRALRTARIVLTPSQSVADELVDRYRVDRQRVVVTGLGVDRGWFEAKPPGPAWLAAHGLPAEYLVFVGSREPRKNLPVLLAAFAAMRRSDASVPPLVLAGPAGWGDPLAPADGVASAGYLDEDDLRQVVAGARCLVYPSRYEGFGLPPLEALACGTAVVASDLPSVREATGGHARLVPAGDVDALVEAMLTALGDDAFDPAPGRAWAAEWTWARCAETTRAAYRQALAG